MKPILYAILALSLCAVALGAEAPRAHVKLLFAPGVQEAINALAPADRSALIQEYCNPFCYIISGSEYTEIDARLEQLGRENEDLRAKLNKRGTI